MTDQELKELLTEQFIAEAKYLEKRALENNALTDEDIARDIAENGDVVWERLEKILFKDKE